MSRRTFTRRELLASGVAAATGFACAPARDVPGLEDVHDLCVIGSGFAGLTVALRAVAEGRRTIVIEAGTDPTRWFARAPPASGYESSGEVDYPVDATRVIAVGGTSHHWSGTVNRMRPSDFRLRSEFGQAVDWPLGYEELEPYYCRAERDLAVRGHPEVAGAEPRRGCPYPEEVQTPYRAPDLEVEGAKLAYFPLASSRRDGAPVRLAAREASAFAASPRGTLLEAHAATRLVTRDGRTLDHVRVRDDGGRVREVRAKVFVLAAGVVESARLLLLSRSRWHPDGIGNRHDLVGRFFNVHPTVLWEFDLRPGVLSDDAYRGPSRTYTQTDAFRRRGLNGAHFQLHADGRGTVSLKLQPEIEPRADNRVTLAATGTDAAGDPLPELSFGYGERDRLTTDAGLRDLEAQTRVLRAPGAVIRRLERWRCHPAGTVRMAGDERHGVVDPNGQVFGIENLFVSGACTFPTSGTANPTATVVALAHRLADYVL